MRAEIAIPHTSPINYNLNWTTFQAASSSFIKNFTTASFTMQAEALGLLESNDIVVFDDEEWGILDDLAQPLRIYLPTTFGMFGSGMGGYVAVDLSDCNNCKATLWFSNRQPSMI